MVGVFRIFAVSALFLGASVLSAVVAPERAHAQTSPVIQGIQVEGAKRIEISTIESYLLVRRGDPFDAARIDRSLKSLFATGLFADVSMSRQGDDLVVSVVENPVINRIAFEGNQRIDDKKLEAETSLKPRVIFTRSKVQADVKRLLDLYRRSGRFAATVEPKVIQLDQNRVDLVFEVSEGGLTEVSNIRFVGNRAFDDGELREVVLTRETRWYRFLTSDDTYDPDRITFDRELMRRYYLQHGYADFRVVSAVAELTPNRESFFITYTIDEGPRYAVGTVNVIANLRDLDAADVQDDVQVVEGDWYNSKLMDGTIEALTTRVGNMGYAFVDIKPKLDRKTDERLIDLTFEINEGSRVFVERINIQGNVRTLDEVVRREFQLVEGDAFNVSKLDRSRRRIQDLDFFSVVNFDRLPGSAADKAVIDVTVEEKSTGSLSVGAGFSTTAGALADISIRERNLLGKGQDLKVGMSIAQLQSQIDLSFTEPHFMDRDLSAGFDLYRTTVDNQDSSSYSSKTLGFGLRMGYPLGLDLNQSWSYSLRQSEVTSVAASASTLVAAQEGTKTVSELGHSINLDKRDSRINPTDGYYARMTNGLAGLGGDVSYLRNTINAGTYYKVADGWVVGVNGKTGYIYGLGEDVTLLDRYYMGGDDLRGFANSGVGPRDKLTKDALGGQWMYNGTVELSVPLGIPEELGISGKVFTDLGALGQVEPSNANVYDNGSLRMSSGVGVKWVSPVGPISLDFSQALLKQSYDITETMRINFGTKF